jgi:hypothetical protein
LNTVLNAIYTYRKEREKHQRKGKGEKRAVGKDRDWVQAKKERQRKQGTPAMLCNAVSMVCDAVPLLGGAVLCCVMV